jgi:hypothetical protein
VTKETSSGPQSQTFNGTATVDLSTVMGDSPKQGFVMPYLIDVSLSIDTGRMGLWQGGEAFIDFQQAGSANLATDYVPDFWGWNVVYPFAQDFTELGQSGTSSPSPTARCDRSLERSTRTWTSR